MIFPTNAMGCGYLRQTASGVLACLSTSVRHIDELTEVSTAGNQRADDHPYQITAALTGRGTAR